MYCKFPRCVRHSSLTALQSDSDPLWFTSGSFFGLGMKAKATRRCTCLVYLLLFFDSVTCKYPREFFQLLSILPAYVRSFAVLRLILPRLLTL